ncbi:NlpC/P60 family protein [Albidovulum inexpectatum]|uniref:NlpC/P60 family protein n=1 Tax=Albidovulum inexpectatum TaxID=196587 RepID=A0A2S5JM34_9RHOB|nr:NlpC/P60 family protein [Albidovulum inexpectatum]PPB82305.1 NlpC/P60 family protein [Albidovulum inexpectatum]
MTSDRRLLPANGRVAHVSLRGKVAAETYVEGSQARIVQPVADLLAAPGGPRDRQLLWGEGVLVLDRAGGHAFVRSDRDGYCGYVAESALGPAWRPTHWVSAPATHLYPSPDMKRREVACISLGARLQITGREGGFARSLDGLFVPAQHLRELGAWADDPVRVAASFLGTPYLWGGNSRQGIDCSGLVQAALTACGIACPGDSDLQQMLGDPLPEDVPMTRGDLIFWKGHVAMAVSGTLLIHANAHRMAVTHEGIDEAIARIEAQGEGRPTSRRRLSGLSS